MSSGLPRAPAVLTPVAVALKSVGSFLGVVLALGPGIRRAIVPARLLELAESLEEKSNTHGEQHCGEQNDPGNLPVVSRGDQGAPSTAFSGGIIAG